MAFSRTHIAVEPSMGRTADTQELAIITCDMPGISAICRARGMRFTGTNRRYECRGWAAKACRNEVVNRRAIERPLLWMASASAGQPGPRQLGRRRGLGLPRLCGAADCVLPARERCAAN